MKIQIGTSMVLALLLAAAADAQQAGYYMPVNCINNGGYDAAPAQVYDNGSNMGYASGYDSGCGGNFSDCGSSGRYLSMFGGWTKVRDASTDIAFTDQNFQTQVAEQELLADNGWCIGGSVGRRLGQRFRTDMEFAYRNNSMESVSFSSPGNAPFVADLEGKLNLYSGITNLFFDFRNLGKS
jgi:hypothetical protein